jgi:hypothetical protein
MDRELIDDLLHLQHGVVSRRQVLDAGGSDVEIERLLRRREWAPVHRGVYVAHTGPLTSFQRAWAALLRYWPAVLAGASALQAHGLRSPGREEELVEVAVAGRRHLEPTPGIRPCRLGDFEQVALLHLSPPRVRLEHAVLTVASRARSEDAAVAVLADACQSRRTTPALLRHRLDAMARLPRRRLLGEVLADVAQGAFSALERRYLRDVERAHGLPGGRRQRRVRPGRSVAHRDVDYLGLRTVVELDGRLGHEWNADRWADLDRDIDSLVTGDVTLRAGWRQVLDPCRLAAAVARVLIARGWTGRPHGCRPGCPVGDIGGFPAPAADNPPLS